MPTTIYTLGYQGLTLGEYIELLKEQPISEVIDVRTIAWSRKPGFSKSVMQQGLEAKNIKYLHLQSAGNPFRKDEDGENILAKYKHYLRNNQESLTIIEDEVSKALKQKSSVCLTCFEKEPQDCHRSIITEILLKRDSRLHVVHLRKQSKQLTL